VVPGGWSSQRSCPSSAAASKQTRTSRVCAGCAEGRVWYVGHDGKAVDAQTRERISALAIPPTWREVWISPHDIGHTQAMASTTPCESSTSTTVIATARRREASEVTDRARSRVGSAIADITTTAAVLVRDVTLAPAFRVKAITDLTAAVMRFALEVGRDHPHVAAWALSQQQLINRHQGIYRNRFLNPWAGNGGFWPGPSWPAIWRDN